MKVIVMGGTGTIGSAVAAALEEQDHEVIRVARSDGDRQADLEDRESMEELYRATGPLDAVVCAAGTAVFGALPALDLADHRINVVSPGWVAETMEEMGMDPSPGTPAAQVARTFVRVVEGDMTGEVVYVDD